MPDGTPRTAYGADFIKVKQNSHGYWVVLGIIDLSTGNLVLRALKNRTAENTAHVILYDIITKKGGFLVRFGPLPTPGSPHDMSLSPQNAIFYNMHYYSIL